MIFAASFAIPIPGWAVLPLLVVALVVGVAQGFSWIAQLLRTRSGSSRAKQSADAARFAPYGTQSHGDSADPNDSSADPSLEDGPASSTVPLQAGSQRASTTKRAFWLATRNGAIVAGAATLIGAAQRLLGSFQFFSRGGDVFYQLSTMRNSPLYLIMLALAAAASGWTATARGNSVVLWPGVAAGTFVVFFSSLVPVLLYALYDFTDSSSIYGQFELLTPFLERAIFFSLIGAVIALVAAAIGRPAGR
jgi:hypothetical protein